MQLNKILEYAAYALGGTSLLLASLLVFALAAGVPAHSVAIVGGLFPEPPSPVEPSALDPTAGPARPKVQPKTIEDVIASTLSRLPASSGSSPFESTELETLVGDLKRLKLDYEQQLESLEARDAEVTEREEALHERADLLQDLMAQLDQREGDIRLQEAELKRDQAAASDSEKQRWKKIATAFTGGDTASLAKRLENYGPEEGAYILANLEEEQRNALLMALPESSFKDFNDAYSALGD